MNLSNKIALVTGGSRGLGRNIALALAARGADVILTYRERKSDGEAVAAEIEALGRRAVLLQLDVASTAGFPAFADSLREALVAGAAQRVRSAPRLDGLVEVEVTQVSLPVSLCDSNERYC